MKEYRNPVPTVDIIIESESDNNFQILLIKRKNPPHGYALPGGFVDEGESLQEAALREAMEETGVAVDIYHMLHTYSAPGRDPRMHTISAVFVGRTTGKPEAGDDAEEVFWVDPTNLPPMAFDHADIVADYLEFKKNGKNPPWNR